MVRRSALKNLPWHAGQFYTAEYVPLKQCSCLRIYALQIQCRELSKRYQAAEFRITYFKLATNQVWSTTCVCLVCFLCYDVLWFVVMYHKRRFVFTQLHQWLNEKEHKRDIRQLYSMLPQLNKNGGFIHMSDSLGNLFITLIWGKLINWCVHELYCILWGNSNRTW